MPYTPAASMPIPARLHFLWIGPRLPWFVKLAIQSALARTPGAQLSLWASEDLGDDPHVRALRELPGFSLQPLDEHALFDDAPGELPVALLARLFAELEQPAARANLARLLILARFGGIYLDTDTLTLRDLTPLLALEAFCGLEHVIWPLHMRYGVHPYRVIGGPLRGLLRNFCAAVPRGEQLFQRVTPIYHTAANNAVLGFRAGHPFLLQTLARIAELTPAERTRRYRLGTHLLQEMLVREGERLGVTQLSPAHFYPLGPEISRQYFRPRRDVEAASHALIRPETYLLHWYGSLSELAPYDEARVYAERDRTLFAQLAARALAHQ